MATEANKNFQVSAVGGAGSSGQPAQYLSGGAYGEGKENWELQTAAKMNKSGVNVPTGRGGRAIAPVTDQITPLSAFTERPDEHIATGTTSPGGAGPEILSTPGMLEAQNNEDLQKLAAFMPVYAKVAESPNASNATRNFYRWMRANIQ